MTLTVRAFDRPGSDWDQFGQSQPGWTAFHQWAWKAVIEQTLGHRCLYWGAFRPSGELDAILPLVRVKSVLFGHYLMSMPFLNYGGPLGGPDGVKALGAAAAALAQSTGAGLVELRSRIELPLEWPVSHRKVTVVLDLPEDEAALMKLFPAKLRSQVRRPAKEGMVVRFGADQVDSFYQVFAHHMRDLGTPAMPRRFFVRLAEAMGDRVWFGCAYLDGRPIACGAGFAWETEFEITWASALTEFSRISANMGLYWAFMQRALAHGIRRFNFGRCSPDSGTHRFKRQWGAVDEPLWWYQHSLRGVVTTPSPDHGALALGPKLWKRLPLGVAGRLGPPLARFLP